MKFVKHVILVALGVFVLLGLPFMNTDYFSGLVSGADAVSSASAILDSPSGEYIVWINAALHTDEEKLDQWIHFFKGEEISYIFEDLACSVADGDPSGLEMAQSYQSRLPENQMILDSENSIFLLSAAENDQFDIVVMSKEFADSYGASPSENTIVIEVGGDAQ